MSVVVSNSSYLTEGAAWDPRGLSSKRAPGGRGQHDATVVLVHDATVLLVDDRLAARTSLEPIMRSVGYHVIMAEDGVEARFEHVDALVFDTRLSGLDGPTLLAMLGDPPSTMILPVTELAEADKARVGRAVVVELRKPVAPRLLLDAIPSPVGEGP